MITQKIRGQGHAPINARISIDTYKSFESSIQFIVAITYLNLYILYVMEILVCFEHINLVIGSQFVYIGMVWEDSLLASWQTKRSLNESKSLLTRVKLDFLTMPLNA